MTIYAVNGKEPVAVWVPSLDDSGNGTTTLNDLVGANDGTLTNMDAGTDWVADTGSGGVRALDFDGVNDYVVTGSSLPALTSFSISMWVKQTDASRVEFAISNRDVALSNGIGFLFEENIGPEILFNNSGALSRKRWGANLSNGWHHIVGLHVAGSNQLSLYVDGVAGGATLESAASDPGQGGVLALGRDGSDPTPYSFLGRIDDIRIFDQALTADDIKALYIRGRGATTVTTPDVSVNAKEPIAAWIPSVSRGDWDSTRLIDISGSNVGTLTNMDAGTDWVADTGSGGVRALDFDGTNDEVTLDANLPYGQSARAISAWVYLTSYSGSYAVIFSHGVLSAGNALGFLVAGNGGYVPGMESGNLVVEINTSNVWSTGYVPLNSWSHIAFSHNSGNTIRQGSLWINGAAQSTEWGGPVVVNTTASVARFGDFIGLWGSIPFRLDDVRFFDQALTADDITYLYASGNGRGIVPATGNPTGNLLSTIRMTRQSL